MINLALQALFPDRQYEWQDTKPRGHWTDLHNQKLFFDKLGHKLNIKKLEDWYRVPSSTVLREGGSFITKYYNSSILQGASYL
jgi:hypothetical protein